jgi:S-adenosylmethionine hydrolase
MARRYDTISFLTDYGTVDEFVGVVKSVVREIAAHVTVIDITHEVPAFDVRAGSLTLARAISYVPSGVVLAVVDPGVGTSRRSIAIEVGDGEGVLVGPDNGLLAPAVAMAGGAGRAVVLSNTDYQLISSGTTFAGRDIFAPAAAHLCNGVDLYELGDPIDAEVLVPGVIPLPRTEGDALVTEVLWVDRFGNCQLNVGPTEVAHFGDRVKVTVGELTGAPLTRIATLSANFSELGTGVVGLVTDSYGMLALCLDRRSAAQELHIGPSDQVVLEEVSDGDDTNRAGTDLASISSPVNLRINR